MRSAWICLVHWGAVALIGLAVVCSSGCRQSRTEQEAERREQADQQHSVALQQQQAEATNRERYEDAKRLVKQGQYEEAWEEFQKVVEGDEKLQFEFEMYKNETLPEELFRQADRLSSVDEERFQEAWRRLQFVRMHMDKKRAKAEEKMRQVKRCHDASSKYRAALQQVRNYQHERAVALLKDVRDNYGDTPYGDMATERLLEINPPEEPPLN